MTTGYRTKILIKLNNNNVISMTAADTGHGLAVCSYYSCPNKYVLGFLFVF